MAAHAIALPTIRAGRRFSTSNSQSIVMMDTATYKVVYVDRRISLDRDLQRDDPLPIIAPAPTGGSHQFYADDSEVIANIQAILSVFTAGKLTCRRVPIVAGNN